MSKRSSKASQSSSKGPESYTMARFLRDVIEVVVPAIILFFDY